MKVKELLKYPLIWLFALLIFGFMLMDFILPDRLYSEFENTKLQQKPEFTIAGFFDSTYSTKYETYVNEQFPARDQWITLKAITEIGLGKLENNNIIYGKDDYLFEKLQIIPEPNASAGSNVANMKQIERNWRFMNEFFQMYDLPVTFALAPNSYAVMTDKLPYGTELPNQETMIPEIYNSFTEDDDLTFINFLPSLKEHQDEYVYYRTDHHWTTLGAYYAYVEYCNEKGLKPMELDGKINAYTVWDFYGTYYNKCKKPGQYPDQIHWFDIPVESFQFTGDVTDENMLKQAEVTEWNGIPMLSVDGMYQQEQFETRDKYAAFTWGNNGLTQIVTGHNNDPQDEPTRLLLIKDSYANSMVPYLTYNYDEIWIIDLRSTPMHLSQILKENEFDDIFVMYNFSTFLTDTDIARLRF